MGAWQYTFTDLRSGTELGTFPLTGVKYGLALAGAAPIDAYLSLLNDKVREDNPWAATIPRRTGLWVEYEDDGQTDVVWGGVVWARLRKSSSRGLALSGHSWESWLAKQALSEPSSLIGTAVENATHLIAQIAGQPGYLAGGFDVRDEGTGPAAAPMLREYEPRELRMILELLGQLAETGQPSEFRVHSYRDPVTGVLGRTVVIGEPRIGRTYEDTALTFAYPDGALKEWTYPEDESDVSNRWQVLGSGSGPAQPFLQLSDTDVGVDELASGYPSTVGSQQESQESNQNVLYERGKAGLLRSLTSGQILTGLKVRPDGPPRLGSYWPGDDLGFEITDPVFPEYPEALTVVARLLSMTVTPAEEGGVPTVDLTVGGTT